MAQPVAGRVEGLELVFGDRGHRDLAEPSTVGDSIGDSAEYSSFFHVVLPVAFATRVMKTLTKCVLVDDRVAFVTSAHSPSSPTNGTLKPAR
jgi:hypothetical protein